MSKTIPAVPLDAEGPALLREVLGYYHTTLKTSPEALDYLKARCIYHPEAIERFHLGYANRTLGLTLPDKAIKAGGLVRSRLAELGLYRDTGHEHFNGSLVIPVMDEADQVAQVYGRKIQPRLRKGTPLHVYLPGPLRGVWNLEAIRESQEVILAKSLIDGLSWWCAGHHNVTGALGSGEITPDQLEAFERYRTRRVLIGFDGDEAGDQAAEQVEQQLQSLGIECRRLRFPQGMDANDLVRESPDPEVALGRVIQAAEHLGNARRDTFDLAHDVESVPTTHALPSLCEAVELPFGTAVEAAHEALEAPKIPAQVPAATTSPEQPAEEIQGTDLILRMGDRTYRVRGWQKCLSSEVLKVNLMASREGVGFHIDSLDLFQAKARVAFIRQAGLELCVSEDRLKGDLGRVLRRVEELQAEELAKALAPKDPRPTLTAEEHAAAMDLLQAPDLLQRVLRDFETLGVVGEESNKLVGYLAAVSRLLDRPLALLIQSASAAGKTSLMDAVLNFIPDEERVQYSAMSGQSLFYMGGNRDLKHKVLAISEEEGAKQASYALKLLQSEGSVTIASTGKSATTGMLETHDYTVVGPVMLFLTTTSIDLDEELLNRCLVLEISVSREQTRAIHAQQRSRETLEGLMAKTSRDSLIKLHRNAQRLLDPLVVINPFAEQLRFHDHQTRSRRDHVKYLTLIRSVALLHQHQREIKTFTQGEQSFQYLEVVPSDVATANALALEVLSRCADELLPQTRKLLGLLHGWVAGECERLGVPQTEFRFTRRQVREALGWGDTQLKVHLGRLADLEFLVVHRGSHSRVHAYELLFQGEDEQGRARVLGLIDPSTLTPTGTKGSGSPRAGSGRGMVGGPSAGSREQENHVGAMADGALGVVSNVEQGKGTPGVSPAAVVSYPQSPAEGRSDA